MADRRHLANDAWEAMLSAHASLMKRFAAQDIWQDLSMREYDVLYTLSKCPDPVRLSELNRHVLLSQPALSRMVDRLTERGLVERQSDPVDGRVVRLSLTGAGRALQRGRALARPQRGRGHDCRADPRRTPAAGSDLPETEPFSSSPRPPTCSGREAGG